MKAYPEYKASGIDWLEDIPSHWKIVKGAWCCTFQYGFPADSRFFSNERKGIPLIRIRDIYSQDTEIYYNNSDFTTEYIVNNGDILIGMDGDFNVSCWQGDVALLNQRVCKFEKSDSLIKGFLFYVLPIILKEINNIKYSTTVKHLSAQDLSDMRLPIPSLVEQEAIAAYLDDVTGKIDALISEKRKQVEDIRAYRTSLITETVTRGLNPDAPLRPSGIDWLGDIPKHWETIKTSYIFDSIGSGTTPTAGEDQYYEGGSINWLQTGDLNDGVINSTSKKITPFAVESRNLKFYDKGSVVIAMYGATIAKLGLLDIQTTVNQACCVLTPSSKINSKYVFYFFYSAKNELISLASGGGQPNISQATISNFKMLVPPLAEQQAIADFLDAKTAKIDELISELTKQIDELAEYKQAVITEAVTGKVDVRDYKPSN